MTDATPAPPAMADSATAGDRLTSVALAFKKTEERYRLLRLAVMWFAICVLAVCRIGFS
jgi:hypothetical protein